jgi:phosphatidylinositol glycan class U
LIVGLIATFQSYPTLADIGLFHALLLLFPHLGPALRYPLVSAAVLAYSLALLPTFHYLWLYSGSGNSNFYYASTLVYGLGNGFLVADALWAHLKLEFGKEVDITREGIVVIQR